MRTIYGLALTLMLGAPAFADTSISGTVSLAPALKSKAAAGDTVFILARAVQGPPMPLAVIKAKVGSLPMKFVLSDAMAMSPEMTLSKFQQVQLVARVSKSGSPKAAPGDLQGTVSPVRTGSSGVNIVIDSVVP